MEYQTDGKILDAGQLAAFMKDHPLPEEAERLANNIKLSYNKRLILDAKGVVESRPLKENGGTFDAFSELDNFHYDFRRRLGRGDCTITTIIGMLVVDGKIKPDDPYFNMSVCGDISLYEQNITVLHEIREATILNYGLRINRLGEINKKREMENLIDDEATRIYFTDRKVLAKFLQALADRKRIMLSESLGKELIKKVSDGISDTLHNEIGEK